VQRLLRDGSWPDIPFASDVRSARFNVETSANLRVATRDELHGVFRRADPTARAPHVHRRRNRPRSGYSVGSAINGIPAFVQRVLNLKRPGAVGTGPLERPGLKRFRNQPTIPADHATRLGGAVPAAADRAGLLPGSPSGHRPARSGADCVAASAAITIHGQTDSTMRRLEGPDSSKNSPHMNPPAPF
jgi:hypothetical protein